MVIPVLLAAETEGKCHSTLVAEGAIGKSEPYDRSKKHIQVDYYLDSRNEQRLTHRRKDDIQSHRSLDEARP